MLFIELMCPVILDQNNGLTGWGGDVNVSAAIFGGIEWEVMFTGGETGHYLGANFGGDFSLSVEFQRAWTIVEKGYEL